MKPILGVETSAPLFATNPLTVLRALRAHTPEQPIALFRTSDAQGDTFVPRLTIIGLEPLETLQIQGQNPFEALHQRLEALKIAPDPALPFFQGGALGYISYDAIRHLEPTLIQNTTLAPPRYDAEMVFFRYYLIFGHLQQQVVLLSADPSAAVSDKLKQIEALVAQATDRPDWETASEPLNTTLMSSHLGQEAFLAGIAKLKHHLLEGDIFQAVLAERFQLPYAGDPLELFEILARLAPAPYQFYFEIEQRAFLGASPEMLLKSIRRLIETHPIAGTRPRGKNPGEDQRLAQELLADEKEKSEHLMLVDLARNDIGRVAEPGSVKVESFQKVRRFGGVMHLVSVVTGKLCSQLSAIQALASCFPAGTLSGAPKIRAMDLISEIEQAPRGFYGGAFIAASLTGDLDSCIAIRSISIENGMATLQAGAGIVADSVPEKEYEEVQHKTRLTRLALATALQQEHQA